MNLANRISHLPFHSKVLLPVLAILIAMPIITVTLVDQHVKQRSLLVAEEKLAAAEAVLLNSLEIRDRSLQDQFKNAVNEPRFKAVSQLNDADTMRAYLRDYPLKEFSEIEALLYTPIDGSPSTSVRRAAKIDLQTFETNEIASIEAALGGGLHSSISVYSDTAYSVISLPVFLSNAAYPIGSLTIAIGLDNAAIAQLKSLTHTEIILAIDSHLVGSTLPNGQASQAIESINLSSNPGAVGSTLLAEEHFHSISNTLSSKTNSRNSLQYVLLSSYEQELEALSHTRLLLIGISLGGIAFSGLIIYVLIRRITMPLRLLKEGADAVGRGDLSHQVDCQTNDECGDLAQAFNHMTGNLLSSRRDLETSLTELRQTQAQLIEREARLRESEEGLRLIIEGARDHAIFTIDDNQQILRWNTASERILGYNTEEARQLSYSDLFESSERSAELAQSLIENARALGQASYEGWRRRQDGSLFWADITLSRLQIAEGSEKGGYVEITRDITARKETETAMREARDAAEASNRAKSEFLANMSHEFRTPMNGIIGMAGLLSSLQLTEEQREFTDTIRISADNLLSIIDDILDISKIEAGELEVATTPFNLIETIEDSLTLFAPDCEKKALGLNLVVANSVPASVVTDPTRLRQVLVNLVGNAIKFTHNGGITVTVRYDIESSQLILSVTDTGIGIPHELQPLLFDPFYQAQSSATREFGGTGLGLTISRNIVKLLGGSISIESEVGEGSTFSLTLPAPPIEANPPFQFLPGHRALVLVDDPITRDALATQLDHWKLDFECISSSPDIARKHITSAQHDLLIIDQSATRPDTIRVILDCRAEMEDRFPPIIRLVNSTIDKELTHGARCVPLTKPISLRALNRQIRDFRDQPATVFKRSLRDSDETKPASKPTPSASPITEPSPTPAPEETTSETLFADQFPLRLLVVEDNPINTKVLVKLLKKLGYSPETATNGAEGLAAAESMQFDAILMDLQMPVMDGLESARRILASDSIEHPIYISAFTANARAEDQAAVKEAGMHDFVAKPARLPLIQSMLERAHDWVASQVS